MSVKNFNIKGLSTDEVAASRSKYGNNTTEYKNENILLKSIVPVPTGFQSVPSDNFSDIRIKMTNGSNQPPLPFRFPDRRG